MHISMKKKNGMSAVHKRQYRNNETEKQNTTHGTHTTDRQTNYKNIQINIENRKERQTYIKQINKQTDIQTDSNKKKERKNNRDMKN